MLKMVVNLFVSFQNMNPKFNNYYQGVYQARWPGILEALQTNSDKQVLRQNLFLNSIVDQKPLWASQLKKCEFLPYCYWRSASEPLQKNNQGFFDYYIMDPASLLVAKSLEPQPGDCILDMCAAPGGKSLVIAELMSLRLKTSVASSDLFVLPTGSLIANEYSEARRERLLRVFQDYIPKEYRQFISVKGLDGNQYGLRQPEFYDRVLADVPCSGERHLLNNPAELEAWTEKRTKNIAIRQYSLLSSAWLCVKSGGRIVYSTCSMSPLENDQVIAKLLKKRRPEVLRLESLSEFSFLEKTEYGYQILPDKAGFGPMYFSIIQKN